MKKKKQIKKRETNLSCLEQIVAGRSLAFESDILNAIRELNAKVELLFRLL